MIHYKLEKKAGLKKHLSEIKKEVIGHRKVVILLHALWCGHCRAMREDWDAAILSNKNTDVAVIEINSDVFEIMKQEYPTHPLTEVVNKNFYGFPHVLCAGPMKNETVHITTYTGKRTKKDFAALIRRKNI